MTDIIHSGEMALSLQKEAFLELTKLAVKYYALGLPSGLFMDNLYKFCIDRHIEDEQELEMPCHSTYVFPTKSGKEYSVVITEHQE